MAAGFDGLVARSTDGGATWSVVASPTHARLYGAAVDPAGRVWIVGEGGTILRSDDGGRHLAIEPSPVAARLVAVAVAGDRVVAAGDGGVVVERGAAGWRVTHEPAREDVGLRALAPRPDGGGMVAFGYDGLGLRESSPGAWERLPRGDTDALYAMTIAADGTIYGCGSFGTVARSRDGGATFEPLQTGTRAFLRGIDVEGDVIVAVGHGAIVRSSDAGATWAPVLARFPAQLLAVAALPGGGLVGAGEYGAIVLSSDGGATWSTVVEPAFPLNAMAWSGARDVVAVGQHGCALRSTDAGETFGSVATGTFESLEDVCFWEGEPIGIAVARSGVVLRTTDAGSSWGLSAIAGRPRLDAVACQPGGGAVVAGRDGSYLTSTDGGATWAPARSPLAARARGLTSGARTWVAAEDGVLAQSRRPGGPWLAAYTGIDTTLNGVSALGDAVVAVGDGGTLLRSHNGGAGSSFSATRIAGGVTLRAVGLGHGSQLVVAVGDAGTVALSRDGGTTWSTRTLSSLPGSLRGVALRDGGALACGDWATIVHVQP